MMLGMKWFCAPQGDRHRTVTEIGLHLENESSCGATSH
jgi:hypothetical protein